MVVSLFSVTPKTDNDNILKQDVHESVHRDVIMKTTNKMQLYGLIYYSKSALHV
jgi:hypothetical protein